MSTAKAPVNGTGSSDEPMIKVQPPRREDLQPSYATVLLPDSHDADGSYSRFIEYGGLY